MWEHPSPVRFCCLTRMPDPWRANRFRQINRIHVCFWPTDAVARCVMHVRTCTRAHADRKQVRATLVSTVVLPRPAQPPLASSHAHDQHQQGKEKTRVRAAT